MDDVLDVRNPENVCRLCLSTEQPISSVFADQASAVSLATKIQASLSIEIQVSDKVSTLICANCLKRVNDWHTYKEACLRSQEKLQRCLVGERLETIPNIKLEPMDVEEPLDALETVPLTSDEEWEDLPDLPVNASITSACYEAPRNGELKDTTTIKRELLEDEENNANAEIESVCSRELLLNPMAVTGNKDDRIMEADSTQKLLKVPNLRGVKKKSRRGPATHYRGTRRYKQRCSFCQIYLHSKHSYAKHMERFHSGTLPEKKPRVKRIIGNVEALTSQENKANFEETEEMIEDVEDELISLEKDAPLTPVQQNIISQLKTFSCYTCQQCFQDRRSTLNHIRHHMPDLRPYTCIACLTEFADRSIYKLHCGASFQCAMKIALVIPEHGTEKYFTCNMCLRPLANRKELLSHLSKHSDKQYEQLIAEPFRSPPKLKPMTSLTKSPSKIDVKPNLTSANKNKGPYKNGDPAHNHSCTYCGMIYRYKQNMHKHVDLCKKLPIDSRVSYRCAHCGLTFLALKRFHSHLNVEHKAQNIACYHCKSKFKDIKEYSEHYRKHRVVKRTTVTTSNREKEISNRVKSTTEAQASQDIKQTNIKNSATFSCALCPGSSFATRHLLVEHRKVHLKLKIYSCAICRRMFGRASALEAHMADHELDVSLSEVDHNNSIPLLQHDTKLNISINSDPGTSNTECPTCGKVFANYPNLRRHVRNVHDTMGKYSCFTCAKTFKSEVQWADHVENEHRHMEPAINCPQCPEEFDSNEALDEHRSNVHGVYDEDHLACYICGKNFANESSLRIHRGHHFRVNSRLSIGNRQQSQTPNEQKQRIGGSASTGESSIASQPHTDDEPIPSPSLVKSPRARKSFPNPIPMKQLQNMLQCQVCDDRFPDVSSLRKHLWDVHCARNKPEKVFVVEKLQCELCTNVLPDEESLASHMKWHESNPILSDNQVRKNPVECDLCGKFYSSKGNLYKHKKRHKARTAAALKVQTVTKRPYGANGFTCNICRKVFATRSTLRKHKISAHMQSQNRSQSTTKRPQAGNTREPQIMKPVRPKLDFDTLIDQPDVSSSEFSHSNAKKPVTCNLCKKIVPSMRALYKHRQLVHKILIGKTSIKPELEMLASMSATNGNEISCTACPKVFANLPNMKQHFTKVHGTTRNAEFRCTIDGCKLVFKTPTAKQNHEKTHLNVMYTCALCPRYMLSRTAMADHMLTAHKTNYATGNSKMLLCKKINLDNYTVKGAIGRECPVCKINYPNFKSMKIHYLKVHEGAA